MDLTGLTMRLLLFSYFLEFWEIPWSVENDFSPLKYPATSMNAACSSSMA